MADEDRIGRVARAICAADGQDPDEVIHLGVEEVGDGPETYRRDVLVPPWTSYDGVARRFIAAARALRLVE